MKPTLTPGQGSVKVSLKKLFASIADEMRASFATMASVSHAPTRGGGHEDIWKDWLGRYLPTRYRVHGGFIIDSSGQQSLQQDLIIFDRQYSPLLLNKDEVLFVPAEAVYAVIEVKSRLTLPDLRDAYRKIASAKALLRTPAQEVAHAGGVFPPRDRGPIMGYLAASQSTWKVAGLLQALAREAKSNPGVLNGGCVLSQCAFATQQTNRKVELKSVAAAEALFGFLSMIVEDLKPLGTTLPWDLTLYSDTAKVLRRQHEPQEATPPRSRRGLS